MKKMDISKKDIVSDLLALGLKDKRVVVHSSLSSIGYVNGGAKTVVQALLEVCKTVMMPAFCWDSVTYPPTGDYPKENGCDYRYYDNWDKPSIPFILKNMGIEKSLGRIPAEFLKFSNVNRSNHGWHSWASYGENSKDIISNHLWGTTNTPLERLLQFSGSFVLMIGTTLSSCTAIHVAEEMAGREPFIRWVVDENGNNKRVRASGCGKGFHKIEKYCEKYIKRGTIGASSSMLVDLNELILCAKNEIVKNPEVTRCNDSCIRCEDTIKKGIYNLRKKEC